MTIQTVNLGTAPTGAGGDTFRSTGAKMNENFTNNTHAASRYVGTAAGNVMEVGAFGLGLEVGIEISGQDLNLGSQYKAGNYSGDTLANSPYPKASGIYNYLQVNNLSSGGASLYQYQEITAANHSTGNERYYRLLINGGWTSWRKYLTSVNTTVDANGFIKAASPIVKLFADKIEPNDEAAEQPLSFEKPGIGHYLVKGSSGFSKEGWWIEIPTDTHGNKICAVEYQTLENGDLEIKTFKKKLNEEGDIVANLDAPIDIPNNANGEPRWIDIRLNEIKKPVVIKTARTEKQPRMVQQVKYAPQLTYITKYEDLFDDEGKAVIVDGKNYKKPVTHIQTDQNGTPILTNQPVISENGEPVFEWVQAVDSKGNPVFDDVPVLDKDGNPIYDEVTYDPE
ncbi:pyocin knob domain-containing protein [Acinetobacter nosocomialis]|uniref:pyocin knob domain-containing protein n=1 Tax=Acinetobacter nosocomialis TaxID=106654 RepID=UPI00124CA7FE|nr:pyocin knob domain-containing protein [Acinetobacter nosocomialis]